MLFNYVIDSMNFHRDNDRVVQMSDVEIQFQLMSFSRILEDFCHLGREN
jgi:hypothetical protein